MVSQALGHSWEPTGIGGRIQEKVTNESLKTPFRVVVIYRKENGMLYEI